MLVYQHYNLDNIYKTMEQKQIMYIYILNLRKCIGSYSIPCTGTHVLAQK